MLFVCDSDCLSCCPKERINFCNVVFFFLFPSQFHYLLSLFLSPRNMFVVEFSNFRLIICNDQQQQSSTFPPLGQLQSCGAVMKTHPRTSPNCWEKLKFRMQQMWPWLSRVCDPLKCLGFGSASEPTSRVSPRVPHTPPPLVLEWRLVLSQHDLGLRRCSSTSH